jgi:hypothetical protein
VIVTDGADGGDSTINDAETRVRGKTTMNRFALLTAAAAVWFTCGAAEAQWTTVYYGPPAAVYYHPAPAVATTAYYAPAPQTVYYAPAPRAVYYAPAPVAAVPVYTTRYRPLLGGTITRVRYRYAPVAYAPPAATVVHYPAY